MIAKIRHRLTAAASWVRADPLLALGFLVFVVFVAGVFVSAVTPWDKAAIGISLFGIALIGFFGGYALVRSAFPKWDQRSILRTAITFTFVLLWTAVALTVMWTTSKDLKSTDPIRIVFNALTGILKIVVAFYFTAEAASQVADRLGRSKASNSGD